MPYGFRKKIRNSKYAPASYYYDDQQLYNNYQDEDGAFYNETLYVTADRLKEWNTFEIPTKPKEKLEQISNEIRIRIKITKQEIFRIGELLYMGKNICLQEGIKYQEWITENFDFSYPTAHNFVNVYIQCLCYRNIAMRVPSSILYTISQRGFPEGLRNYLFESGILENIKGKELQGIIHKFKNGKPQDVINDLKAVGEGKRTCEYIRYTLDMCENALRTLDDLKVKIKTRGGTNSDKIEFDTQFEYQNTVAAKINKKLYETLDHAITELGVVTGAARAELECHDIKMED